MTTPQTIERILTTNERGLITDSEALMMIRRLPWLCIHCSRRVELVEGRWIDPQATGDDSIWRETCDSHDTFTAEHEVSP